MEKQITLKITGPIRTPCHPSNAGSPREDEPTPILTDAIMNDQQSPFTRAEYAARIAGEWRRGVLSIIEVGRLLNSAKQTLPRLEFNGMVAADLPFPKSTTSMLRRVATRFGNVLYTEKLPPSWMTLYLLSRLPPDEFDRRLADGTINPALEQNKVRGWLEERVPDRNQHAPANGLEPAHDHQKSVQQEDGRLETPTEDLNPPAGQTETPTEDSNPPGGQAETPTEESNAPGGQTETPTEDSNPPEGQTKTLSNENSDQPGNEVHSPPLQPTGNTDPRELRAILDPSAADAVEEAYCALVALWHRAPKEAQNRFAAFVTAELSAIAEARRRGEAGEARRPDGKREK